MRTKVAVGAGLLVGLLLLALARDMSLVQKLGISHRALLDVRLVAVTSTLEILRTLELSEERLQKLFVTRDSAYAAQLERLGHAVEEQLELQGGLELARREREAVAALSSGWSEYRASFEARRAALSAEGAGPGREDVRGELVGAIEAVRARALMLLTVLRAGIEADVARAQAQVAHGERQSKAFAGLALVCALFFVTVTIRSITRPLTRLIEATRAVAEGRFVKLDPRGRDELAELGRTFDTMVERLQEIDQVKSDFLSRVSHELKTPLAAMQETNQLLVEELAGPLTPKQRRLLQLNLDAGRRLSTMLSRLLDLSRLEAGAVCYDVRPLDLTTLVSTAVQELEARMGEKQLELDLSLPSGPVMVDGDRDWLMQVLVNLLENAIKFSPAGRRVQLELAVCGSGEARLEAADEHGSEPGGRRALITVADEGPGVPPEARERIFQRFYQVDRSRRAGGGVGLGLAICRDIVAAHGGAIWMENREAGGSLFSVALPLAATEADQSGAPHGARQAVEG
ncbi:MAG: ATP-binding protein [Myxococcales bacterium]